MSDTCSLPQFWHIRYPANPPRVTAAEARHAIHAMLQDAADLELRSTQIELTALLNGFAMSETHLGRAKYEAARATFLRGLSRSGHDYSFRLVDPLGGFRCLGQPPKIAGTKPRREDEPQPHWIEPSPPVPVSEIEQARDALKGRAWGACMAELHSVVTRLVDAGNGAAGVAAFLRAHKITKPGLAWDKQQARALLRDHRKLANFDDDFFPDLLNGTFGGTQGRSYASAVHEAAARRLAQ